MAQISGELLVRCRDLDDPGGFYRAYSRRLQTGFRFVYDDPRLGQADSFRALLIRIREMEAPADFLNLIARDADSRVRAAVAGNAGLPLDTVEALARDAAPQVRRAAAAHPWTGPALLRRLAFDADERVREQVAVHLATPPDVLLDLTHRAVVENEIYPYLAAIADHPRVPGQALLLLALVPFKDGWIVARRHHLPRPVIERIVEAGPDRCRADLARNATLDAATLGRLAADSSPLVRIAVARNPSTAQETLEALFDDADPAVRAASPLATPGELVRLIDVRSRVVTEQVAGNPITPPALLDRVARTWDSDAHEAVAANPSASPRTLEHLFRAGGEAVKRACLANPSCPEVLLRARAQAQHPAVRAIVAGNPATPRDVLDILVGDPSPEVTNALAGNSSLPPSALRHVLYAPGGAAPNPLAPPDVLWQLAIYENDDNFAQRRQVLANPAFAQAYDVVTTWKEAPEAPSLPPPDAGSPPEEHESGRG